jgi:hypothetical protein
VAGMITGFFTGLLALAVVIAVPACGTVATFSGFQLAMGKNSDKAGATFLKAVIGLVIALTAATIILPEVRTWVGV